MGKYVIESKFENTRCFLEVACENREPYFFINRVDSLKPYTEPDLGQVRKYAYKIGYEKGYDAGHNVGYQQGLSDAWEVVKKLAQMDTDTSESITGYFGLHNIMHNLTASEAIEKIRQYEQEQEEFHVGDEVELKCGVRPAICMQGTKGSDEIYLLFNDGSCGLHSKSEIERKTGRHFPEIVTILENMRGEQDG